MSDSPLFRRPDGRPLPPNHHLAKHTRGSYRVFVTVDRGPKYTGQRISVPVRTHDEEEARARRDILIDGLIRANVLCRDVVMHEEPE